MSALSKIRNAGFSVSLAGYSLEVSPASALTQPQRAFLKTNKAEIIDQLRSDTFGLSAQNNQEQPLITCRGCSHFHCHNEHGGGAGWCGAGVTPMGACHWSETAHDCNKYLVLQEMPL